jgi:hypothetical protein
MRLLHNIKVFGGPSASLLRASIVREKRPFYQPGNYHGDTEAYLDLLRDHDFGFVHQVLTFNRKGEESRTTHYLRRVNSYPAADVSEITKFGPVYLTPEEHAARLREVTRDYYRFLGRSVLEFRGREFWHYHLTHMRGLGFPVSYPRVGLHVVGRLLDLLLNPKRTVEGAVRRVSGALGAKMRPAA